jgi:hypothetical protein
VRKENTMARVGERYNYRDHLGSPTWNGKPVPVYVVVKAELERVWLLPEEKAAQREHMENVRSWPLRELEKYWKLMTPRVTRNLPDWW